MLNIIKPFDAQARNGIQQSYISDLENRERAHVDMYIKAREYYGGNHRTALTSRMREFLHVDSDADFTVNYCPMVIDAKADRLKVNSFDTKDAQKETLEMWWRKNRMDRKQGIVHHSTVRDGDSYVLVEWDNDARIPRYHFEPAYAGEGVMVYYSEERRDEIEFASKHWHIKYGAQAGKVSRLNLYFPNRIEKYISNSSNTSDWKAFSDSDTNIEMMGRLGDCGVTWLTHNRTETGKPLGIPIVHFKNNDIGDSFGESEIANVMPVQDAVNKAMIDLIAVMDSSGVGLLVGYGTTGWLDITVGPGEIAAVSTPYSQARVERLAGEDPRGLLSVYNALVMEVGRISGTPLSYFQQSGQVASSDTLKQQEVGLIAKVKKSQTDFGNSWEDCMMIGRKLHNAFIGNNGEQMDEDVIIDTVWDEAEVRNEKEQAETLILKKELGVSASQAQTEMGYDATQKAAFAREKLRNEARAIRRPVQVSNANAQDADSNLTQTENEGGNNDAKSNQENSTADRTT